MVSSHFADSFPKLTAFFLEMDSAVGYYSKSNMMNPMNCTLLVTRNLSYTWYRDVPELSLSGRLKSIEVRFI